MTIALELNSQNYLEGSLQVGRSAQSPKDAPGLKVTLGLLGNRGPVAPMTNDAQVHVDQEEL